MNKEEIENRIEICERGEKDYLEVGKTKMADRYSKEKYKWELIWKTILYIYHCQ